MSEREILPCPFCGSEEAGTLLAREGEGYQYIECFTCLAQGPGVEDVDAEQEDLDARAADLWNAAPRDTCAQVSADSHALAARVRAIATDYSSDSTHWRRRLWDAAQDGTVGPWRGPESGEEEEPMEAGA